MHYFRIFPICAALALVTGCSAGARHDLTGQSVGEVVTNIIASAQAGDTAPFTPVFKPFSNLQAPQLLGMIQRSGMLTNYAGRLQTLPEGKARLDYHDLQRGCHFQVDLQKDASTWRVTRIWFCR